jgi:hypothetical protein
MKKFKTFYEQDEDEVITDKRSMMETRAHKKDKRLKNLFKTKNLDRLVEYLEDDV